MKTSIVRIGNSQGIRIPKPIIRETGLTGEVDIAVKGRMIIIRKSRRPRSGWAEAFAEMAKNKDDVLLDSEATSLSTWDEEEWQWK